MLELTIMETSSALEIADLIHELNECVIFDDIKPKVRKALVTEYQLYVERTPDKKWKVYLDRPMSESEKIIQSLTTCSEIGGKWQPKVRRELQEAGILVYPEKHYPNIWIACKKIDYIEDAIKDMEVHDVKSFKMDEKMSINNYIIDFYISKGYELKHVEKFQYGCGYPPGPYDFCDCYRCTGGIETSLGMYLHIKKLE